MEIFEYAECKDPLKHPWYVFKGVYVKWEHVDRSNTCSCTDIIMKSNSKKCLYMYEGRPGSCYCQKKKHKNAEKSKFS